ncbi:MAG: iron-sulfur cluster assembly scaffold protein [Actinomycetota bacterium]|nr:iron-sulfur cluster assembly scaffold protein [Actinomycetota bacterium]
MKLATGEERARTHYIGNVYSKKLLERFLHPSYGGDLEAPDGVGVGGNPTCGDVVHFAIKVVDGLISDARFRTQGCATAIAASDAACELVIGSPITLAHTFGDADLDSMLDGIPDERRSCAAITLGALRAALHEVSSRR